jgi:hypothetical protein
MADFMKSEQFQWIMLATIFFMIIVFLVCIIKMHLIKKQYKRLIKELSGKQSIDSVLESYLSRVENVEIKNNQISEAIEGMQKVINRCLKKIGMVRYSAFDNVGSDLSFALAILNENNDGVVLNGIYSADSSNIYAKSIVNGESKYTLCTEEIQALEQAKSQNS